MSTVLLQWAAGLSTNEEDPLNLPTALLCQACGRHFSCRASLRRHLWIHTGVKPHTCDHCNFSCNRRSNLERHVRRHHGPLNQEQTILPSPPTELLPLLSDYPTQTHVTTSDIKWPGNH
ncbi:hypothetical protein Pmani_018738 [Petrolisthes manimaculis]|uniref:C2H2-type domain-containing protein n=1 Tax=Petrolisthes manimaculis TaxID=1843537 RepID=A0AAE1PM40_9EUCA|nr:hypothetical protein Pmani_018738 [Petrolisthes manimaculis]